MASALFLTSGSTYGAGDPVLSGDVLQIFLGLIVVVLLIGASAWFAQRFGRVHVVAGKLRVLGGMSVGARERVVLVQVGETQLVLGVSPGRVQTLHVLERPLQVESAEDPEASVFAQRLASLIKRRLGTVKE
jgi:flagellar protein FliO/FliZ